MTKREYLTQLGFTVGARGRFTFAQVDALKKARPSQSNIGGGAYKLRSPSKPDRMEDTWIIAHENRKRWTN
jgi:hypothetical protein